MNAAGDRLERARARRASDRFGGDGDDPAAGLVNLFDLWMVFAVAVLLTAVGVDVASSREEVDEASRPLDERLQPTGRDLEGRGERLGVAYRLAAGEVVYVPEAEVSSDTEHR